MSVPLSVHGGLPRWHMVMFPVKGRPVMMKAKPWFEDKKLTDLLNNPAPAKAPTAAPVGAIDND